MTLDYSTLNEKTFVITGGTQGLGEAVARVAAGRGAAGLTICGRHRDRGTAVADELSRNGCPTLFVVADLRREADCRRVMAAHHERFGTLFGLCNAAASTARGTLENTSVTLWDDMFALNVRAPFILIQEAARLIRANNGQGQPGGSIVNIQSMSGHGGQPFLTAYSTSKGALATLTKNAANSLSNDRIRVNGLNLGWMATPGEDAIQRAEGKPENWLEKADASTPFGRILRPEQAAKLVVFLWSSDADTMTGSNIDCDFLVVGARS